MTTYVADHETGLPLCEDCGVGACITVHWCECEHCQCDCRREMVVERARRADELDDRPDEQLASLARDMEAERRPDVDVLQRERFGVNGWPTWGRA